MPLKARHDAIGDLDYATGVRRTLESCAADHGPRLTLDHEESMAPGVRLRSVTEQCEPRRADVIGCVIPVEAFGCGQTDELRKALGVIDQR